MAYVIDTGVLLRAFEESAPHHQTVRRMLKISRRAGWELITFPQNMAELWVVSTRSTDHNGYGQSTEATMNGFPSFRYWEKRRAGPVRAVVGWKWWSVGSGG